MMNPLRDQMLVGLQLSGAKPNTQKSYLREVGSLATHPEDQSVNLYLRLHSQLISFSP